MAAPEWAPSNAAGITASSSQQKIVRSLKECIATPVFPSNHAILAAAVMTVNGFSLSLSYLIISASDQPAPTMTSATTHKSLLSPIPGVATNVLQTLVHRRLPQR